VTQPVDAPDGWDMFAADEMRLDVTSTKTVRSAPMLTAPSAQASAVDELLEHHRALPAPSMAPMPAPQQAPAAPRPGPAPAGGFGRGAAESLGRSRRSMLKKEELVVPSPDPVLPPLPEVRALAAGLLATLRNAENASADVRVTLLTTLAQTDLPVLLQRLGAEGRPVEDVQQLVDLIAELAGPEPDGAELDRRWQHAVTVLEAFTDERAEPRRSRPFWKR
jgi:hypothetical protein